jgi:glyoxylase-like metal-dependent hydrolase (beta-lactamase superfamily II)
MSDRLKHDHGVKSRIHEADRELALHPYRYRRESSRWPYPLRHPRAVPILARMTAAGALWVEGVAAKDAVDPGVPLDVPGRPVPVWTPGHTDGHCAFVLPDRGVLFTGDALVTLDPYTGRRGPRMVARAATADVATNATSLDRMAATEARLALPGHGAPYEDGIRAAVAEAHRAGAA